MTVRLFLTGKSLTNHVETVFVSRRLPPKAAVSACRRHSFVEGIRNGGLDVLKTAAVLENPLWAHEVTCPATVFFFPRLAGQDRLAYSVLVLLLFGCLFQPVKTLIANDVFNPAGVSLRNPGVNACGDKLLGKEAVSLIDFFGNLAAYIGQMEKMIFVHSEKAAVPQGSHCIAHAGF